MGDGKDDLRNKLLAGRRRSRSVVATPTDVVAGEGAKVTVTPDAPVVDAPDMSTSPRLSGRDRTSEAMASVAEGTNFIATLARHLGAGNVLNVYVDPNDDNIVRIELQTGMGTPTPKRKRLGSDYHLHIHNPEYWEWEHKWKSMSQEEKIEYATKLGVVWEEHENPKINNMRLTEAVRLHENVEKYKPEYSTVALRKKARDLYLTGQLDMSDG